METADQKTPVAVAAAIETPSLVIFGMDDQKKPHASAFAQPGESNLAQKAAALMGMKCFHPKSEEERALAAQLPRGRIFASGKAFVSFVASGLYKRLCEVSSLTGTSRPKRWKSNVRPPQARTTWLQRRRPMKCASKRPVIARSI